ncbi:MAG: hypothetical protein Tsb009_12080 [Planctomycetaceae bacterium]
MKATLSIATFCLMVFSTSWLSSAQAEEIAPIPTGGPISDREAGRVVLDNTVGVSGTNNPQFGPLLHIDGVFGDYQGWKGNLFQVESFIPIHLDPGRNLFFLSAAGIASEDGDGMGNFGAGYRVYVPGLNRVFTIAGWFDIDDGHSQTYYRAGATFESLGKNLDFIANAYAIVGRDSNVLAAGSTGTAIFSGNNILLPQFRTTEAAYSGADISVGGPVPMLGRYGTRAYVGAHWLTSPGREDAYGVDVRAQQRLNDDVDINFVYSYDDKFKSNSFVSVGFTLPTGKRNGWMKRWLKNRPVRNRLADRIYRNRRISTKVETESLTPLLALDPADGLPLTIFHISTGGTGTGTVEAPAGNFVTFESLPLATRNSFDVIYVNGGAFNTTAGPLTLGPRQRLLSTAITQTVATNMGTFALPGSPTGVFPVITSGPGGNVIAMGSGSEVSGFIVDGSGTGRPIVGTNIVGFNINNTTARNSLDHGIVLTNATGTVAGGSMGIINAVTSSGNPTDGIQIINNAAGGGTLDLLMTNNITNNNGTGVGGTGIRIEAHNGNVINADASTVAGTALSGNTANNNGSGIRLITTTGGIINASLTGNTMTGNTDPASGLSISSTGAGSAIVLNNLLNNVVTGNTGYGINATATGGGAVTINNMQGNDVTGNGAGNLRLSALTAGSTINANIGSPGGTANNFSGSTTGAGIELINTNGNMFVAIRNNMIGTAAAPNSTFGVLGTIDGGAASITIGGPAATDGNMILSNGTSSNTGIAMVFSNTAGTLYAPQLITGNNIISGIGSRGMSVTNQNQMTQLTFRSTNDQITANGSTMTAGGGLLVTNNSTTSTGQINAIVTGGSFSNNAGGDGIQLVSNSGSTLSATVTGATIINNGSMGNPGNGLQFDINGTSTGNLTLLSSTLSNNIDPTAAGTRLQGDGVQININRADALAANANAIVIGTTGNGNIMNANAGDGIEINQNSTGTVTSLTATANVITQNDLRGIFYDAQQTAAVANAFNGTFSGNTIQFNTLAGFNADIRGFLGTRAAPAVLNLTSGNNISFNGQEGILIVTDTDRVRPTVVGVNAVTFNHGGGAVIPHDPNDAAFAAQLPAGTFTPAPRGRFLSTLSDINVAATLTDNTIIGNGASAIAANDDGVSVMVGTDTYVRLDFQRNRAETNTGADFATSSFLSAGNTPDTTINAGIDTLTLDATAQFDLRFLGNRLNTINVGTTNAFFTNADAGKNFVGPNPWTFAGDAFNNRPVFFYRVDNSGTIDASNVIISGGVPTAASTAFTAGRFNLDPGMVFGSAGFATDQPLP